MLTVVLWHRKLRLFFFFFLSAPLSGELVSHVTTNTNTMSEALSEELSLVMWYTGRLVFLLFFMVSQSWKLTLLSCMSLPIIWVVTKAFGYISQVKHTSLRSASAISISTLPLLDNVRDYFHTRHISMSVFQSISKEVMESLAKANQVATETFSYVKTVKCFANEDGETEKYRAQLDKTYALNRKEAAAYAGSMWANSVSRLHASSSSSALYHKMKPLFSLIAVKVEKLLSPLPKKKKNKNTGSSFDLLLKRSLDVVVASVSHQTWMFFSYITI